MDLIAPVILRAPCFHFANAGCIDLFGVLFLVSQLSFYGFIRKYGDNQGTYPCMNLAPLYRITDESVKRELADLKKHPEKIDTA